MSEATDQELAARRKIIEDQADRIAELEAALEKSRQWTSDSLAEVDVLQARIAELEAALAAISAEMKYAHDGGCVPVVKDILHVAGYPQWNEDVAVTRERVRARRQALEKKT